MIFKLMIQQDVREIEVFDDFALVIFEDESVMIAVRPNTLGEFAFYNKTPVGVNSTKRAILFLDKTPIKYYSVVPDTSKKYNFLLNILTGTINTSEGV